MYYINGLFISVNSEESSDDDDDGGGSLSCNIS